MAWNDLDETIQRTAAKVLTRRQLQVFKLHLAGHGTRRTATGLGVTRSTVRGYLDDTHRTLAEHGIRQNDDGSYYHQEAA